MMKCADCLANLGSYVDGELPAEERAEMDEHLKACAECNASHRRLADTSSRVKAGLMRYEAPDVLKARIRASLSETPREEPIVRGLVPLTRRRVWPTMVAAAAVVAIVSSGVTYEAMRGGVASNQAEEQVLSSHIRSLIPGHLTDVASNDQHNVKPWFNGRVNVSPNVPRLDSLGYPLLGGRLDYIEGRNVPVVVYGRRQHIINVFSWPATDAADLPPQATSVNGYHLIREREQGLEQWIVSDLNLPELESFARLLTGSR
jgi:anti-sigma factor RsiW